MQDLKTLNSKQLKNKNRVQLLQLAKSLNLAGLSRLSKATLMDRIMESLEISSGVRKASEEWRESYSSPELTEFKPWTLPKTPVESEIQIPSGYGRTEIRLLVQNSQWIYCYWEIIQESEFLLLSLRVYNVSDLDLEEGKANFYYDLSVLNQADHWYIEVPTSNQEYIVDLGYWDTDGNFRLLARSNRVYVPRESVSDQEDQNWLPLESLLELSKSKSSDLSSSQIVRNK